MKKTLYVLLLIAELFLDITVLSLLSNGSFYIAIAAIVVIWIALLIYFVPKLTKADDVAIKRKLYRRLVLVMAVPMMIFAILVVGFVIAFSMAV
jgi:hypothetical protein